jgi:PAS domain S-box-containing protein
MNLKADVVDKYPSKVLAKEVRADSDKRIILLVDDSPFDIETAHNILKDTYILKIATSGARALDLSRVRPQPDLILLDVMMPEMDGYEVCRLLKADPATCHIPIIFLTGKASVEAETRGFELGATDYIHKPFSPQVVQSRVRTHVELGVLRTHLEEEVKKRTAELRESEQRFRIMADAAPVMIWASGTDKLRTFFNKGWLEFTGRSMDDELGNGWTQNVHREDVERCIATYSSAFDARQAFTQEYRLRRADGVYRWVLVNGVPRFSSTNTFEGYVGSCVDFTDLKEVQEKMLVTQKLESLGRMAAGVAHDFGNLLGTVQGEIDLVLSEMSVKAPGRKNLQRIEIATTRAAGIVKLLMASAGAGGISTAMEPVNLSFIAEQMLGLLKFSISKQASVHTSLSPNLPAVRGNIAEIQLVVMNLISNAVEALGGQPGSITVSTDTVRLGPGYVDLPWASGAEGDHVRLKVADTGCGMDAETRTRIFDQFFTTKSESKGLGLSVVYGIVRSHRGAINVESTVGKGSTFEVLFPCA